MSNTTQKILAVEYQYPLLDPADRLAVWERVRGMWKYKKPDPVKELAKVRKQWNRRLPKLK